MKEQELIKDIEKYIDSNFKYFINKIVNNREYIKYYDKCLLIKDFIENDLMPETIDINFDNFKDIKNNKELAPLTFKLYNPSIKKSTLPVKQGLYMFIANKDFTLYLKKNYEPFISLYINKSDNKSNINMFLIPVPKLNKFSNEEINKEKLTIEIKKGDLMYVGRAKNIAHRYKTHCINEIQSTDTLRLGLREELFNNLSYYHCVNNKIGRKYNIDTDNLLKYGITTTKSYTIETIIRWLYQSRFGD